MTIEPDGFQTVHATGADAISAKVNRDAELCNARYAIQDALNLLCLGDNFKAREVLAKYLRGERK